MTMSCLCTFCMELPYKRYLIREICYRLKICYRVKPSNTGSYFGYALDISPPQSMSQVTSTTQLHLAPYFSQASQIAQFFQLKF
ncbi:hypothetical protein ACN38_g11297 [Penicillium nordicum]|uniref:Uncharacterized protein n=1 Tax=Penicillium nordicum TaxID=229535 RepID=A0A0M8NSK3_9EURO|nr:hypothetical protein ACN38_g11297 [Penicillium nordicum]